jgi:hypothetical protein
MLSWSLMSHMPHVFCCSCDAGVTGVVLEPQLCIVTEFAPFGSLSDVLSVPYESSGPLPDGSRRPGGTSYTGSSISSLTKVCFVCVCVLPRACLLLPLSCKCVAWLSLGTNRCVSGGFWCT